MDRTSANMTRRNVAAALGLALLTLAYFSLVSKRFYPIKVTVDLTRADQQRQLEGPWDLRPDKRFPGVMSAFDRGHPVDVLVTLPSADRYEGRLKFKFHNVAQTIEVRANGIPLMVVRPSRCGSAEKFTLRFPQNVLVKGVNRISFANTGMPGGTEYEMVRLQNYSAILADHQAYLLPADQLPRFSRLFPYRVVCSAKLFWLMAATTVVMGALAVLSAALVRRGLGAFLWTSWQYPVRYVRRAGLRGVHAAPRTGRALLRLGSLLCGRFRAWLLRVQSPEHYARVGYGLAGVALVSHWVLRWEPCAKWMGFLAALVLIIAVAWDARRSPRAHKSPLSVTSDRAGSDRSLERRLRLAVALGTAALLSPILLFPATKGFSEANAFFAKPHEAIKRSVLSGQLPLWDPSSGGGESMLADPSSTQFYPPMWMTFLAPTAHTALWWIVHLHLVAAAVGSYTLARWIGCRPIAALLAPLGFIFNAHVSSMLVNGGFPILCAFTWLSWGTAFLWRGATQNSPRYLVGAGACLAVQVFGGMGYEMQFPILLYGLLLVIVALSRPSPWKQRAFQLGRQAAMVFGSAFGLSAVKLLPIIQFLSISTRGGWSLADVEAQPPPALGDLADLLLSRFFEVVPLWGPGARWVSWIYAALMLIALWSLCRKGALWRPTAVFFLGFIVACWVTLGPSAPIDLLAVLYHLLPGFRSSASAPRILIMTRLAIPILAAIGASIVFHGASARAPWLRRLLRQGAVVFGVAFIPWVYAPFISYVTRYPEYGHVERVRTGFLAAPATTPDVRIQESAAVLEATVSLKNVGDESWEEGAEIQWTWNDTPFHTSATPRRVRPGEVVPLQVREPLPAPRTTRVTHLQLSVGEDRVALAAIERLANGTYFVKTAPPTIEAILAGQGLLGKCPDDWNTLLGMLSRWHAPDAFRVFSEFKGVYPYTALLHGFQVDSYTNSTVRPRYLWPLRWDSEGARGSRLLRIMNVRYLLLPADHAARLGTTQARLLKTGAEVNLYELTSALPRVWFPAAAALLVGNNDGRDMDTVEAKLVVYHPAFDPSTWAVFWRRVSCLDDLALDEITPFSALLLTRSRIRDPQKAKRLLEAYRNAGGRVVQLPYTGYQYVSSRDVPGSILDDGLPAITFGTDANAGLSELFAAIPGRDRATAKMVIEHETLSYRRLHVETARDMTPLVMSETYFPGWKAAVDGRRVPLYMVDGMIRGVMLRGPGVHTVEVWYNPPMLWWGGAVTLGSLIGILGFWLWRRREGC